MHSLITTAVNRSRTVFLLLTFLFVAGAVSYISIPKESSPDIPIPIIYISMTHDGISPEDAVNLLVKPMEQEMTGLEGLDEIESTAYEGGANVLLRFDAGTDNDQALTDVRERVDIAKADLPQGEEAEEPRVSEINISLFPILTVILSGDVPERTMKVIAEDLQDRIEALPGVLEAKINGMREEMVVIEGDNALLQSYGITPQQIINVINQNNLLVPAGSLEVASGRYAIKVPGLFRNAEEILNLPLVTQGDRMVRMRDVGTVKLSFKDAETVARVNGHQAMTLAVSKRIGENLIETVDEVKAVVEETSAAWPKHLNVSFTSDESESVRSMLSDLQNNVALSIVLVMVVVVMALGFRPALLVAITIPGSFLTAVIALQFLGITMNIVVLFALILAVGMLVDGAVVVTELADQKMSAGMGRKQAFIEAAQYMAWPIIASTATTLAVFLPLLFWPGMVGEFMKFMPLTLILTLTASLLMALVFLPTMGAAMKNLKPSGQQQQGGPMAQKYASLLEKLLNHPGRVIVVVLLGFVAIIMVYARLGNGVEFFPPIEPERANLLVHAKGDLSITEKDTIMQAVQQRILGISGVKTIAVTTGVGTGADTGPSDVIGNVFFEYEKWGQRGPNGRTSEVILKDALERLEGLYGIKIEEQPQQEGPGEGKPVKILVSGNKFSDLGPVVAKVRDELENIPHTKNVDDNLPEPGIEWVMNVDRAKAAQSNTNLAEAGGFIRLMTTGAVVGEYRPADKQDEIDIVARMQEEDRTLTDIQRLFIATSDGQRVPISNFMTREATPKVTVVRRQNQRDAALIEADVEKDAGGAPVVQPNKVVETMKEKLSTRADELPPGVRVEFKGEDEDQKEASMFLMKAFGVAIFIMALILVTQFNSYYQAFIILSAVVLSTAGVLIGHLVMGKPFGIVMSGVGVISLAGIVVNNNIVLIDTYNKLKAEMPWRKALVETGRQRLRPVMLTAVTTMAGLVAMALRLNVDILGRSIEYNAPSTQWWDQLASSIIFGLAFATMLTLVVTPCMIALAERRHQKQ